MQSKEEKAYIWCLEKLYDEALPKTSYKGLLSKASKDEQGRLVIPYWDYEVEEEKYNSLVEEAIRKFKIKGYTQQLFRNTVHLGCSPKIAKK